MESNVLSWAKALRQGLQPGLYSFVAAAIPTGKCTAMLDFKIWAKKTMAISCYFTQPETGNKFQLTVYLDKKTGRYAIPACSINFADCATESTYSLDVGIDSKRRTKLLYAELLSD